MQFISNLNKQKVAKAALIILSIPIMVTILYYINLFGVYFGTALRRLIFYWPC